MRCQEQPQDYEEEKPFHGRPPFAAGAASHVFPSLKVTGITQIADQGPAKPAIYKSVIPVTFTHANRAADRSATPVVTADYSGASW